MLFWVGLFLMGVLAAYYHFYLLKLLVFRLKENYNKKAQQIFQVKWWIRQLMFLIIMAIVAAVLKYKALPFLLGVVVFEIIGKKILIWKYRK